MEELKRKYRVAKLTIIRLKGVMSKLVEPTISIENLAELECLVSEFCEAKQTFSVISDEILGQFDESDKDYVTNINPYLEDANQVS